MEQDDLAAGRSERTVSFASTSAALLTSEQFGLDVYDVAADIARQIEISASLAREPRLMG